MKTLFFFLVAASAALGSPLFQNNTPDSLNLTLYDTTMTEVTSTTGLASASSWSPVAYRTFYLQVSSSDAHVTDLEQVYLSDATEVSISGSESSGSYHIDCQRFADYESMFWLGFGTYVGLWVCTMYLKFIRAGVQQQVG